MQVDVVSAVAEDESLCRKPKISIVINEEKYDFNFLALLTQNVNA